MAGYILINLGCPKNEVDGQYMETILREEGFYPAQGEENSDIVIINTCGFIVPAQEESINTILDAARLKEKKDLKLIVVGCLSQRFGEELARDLPEVDVFLGVGIEDEFRQLLEKIKLGKPTERRISHSPPFSRGDYSLTHRQVKGPSAYLKIAEGCNNLCSYCAIPSIRGSFSSRKLEDLEREAISLAEQGVVELVLVAQDTTRYGIDLYGEGRLIELLKILTKIEGIYWIRLMYLQPGGITDELLDFIAGEEKVLSYLEIPLQHVSPRILKAMNREGEEDWVRELIRKIRAKIPGVFLRTTLMVGFPGEDREDYLALKEFIEEIRFERLGLFKFSREQGTPAAKLGGQVPERIKEERYQELEGIQKQIALEHNQELVGKVFDVLVEEIARDHALGRTKMDAPEIDNLVIIEGEGNLQVGGIYPVRINMALEYELVGEICNEFAQ